MLGRGRLWPAATLVLAVGNLVLYVPVGLLGAEDIKAFLALSLDDTAVLSMSCAASACYAAFFYLTIRDFKAKPHNLLEGTLQFATPLSASAYFTAGKLGTSLFPFASEKEALGVDIFLFICRTMSCVDGCAKLTARLSAMKGSWISAWSASDYKEMSRLLATALIGMGFSVYSSDAIYDAVAGLASVAGVSQELSVGLSLGGAFIGSLGLFPLTLGPVRTGVSLLTTWNPKKAPAICASQVLVFGGAILGALGVATQASGKAIGSVPGSFLPRVILVPLYALAATTAALTPLVDAAISKVSGGCKMLATAFYQGCCHRRRSQQNNAASV